jgi:hypothetical protein
MRPTFAGEFGYFLAGQHPELSGCDAYGLPYDQIHESSLKGFHIFRRYELQR